MLFGKVKKAIEDKESEIKLNLSNNYKDAAYSAFVELKNIVEEYKSNGKISDKDYDKLSLKIQDYEVKFSKMKR